MDFFQSKRKFRQELSKAIKNFHKFIINELKYKVVFDSSLLWWLILFFWQTSMLGLLCHRWRWFASSMGSTMQVYMRIYYYLITLVVYSGVKININAVCAYLGVGGQLSGCIRHVYRGGWMRNNGETLRPRFPAHSATRNISFCFQN